MNTFRGESIRSSPSVRAMGEVVRVMMEAPVTSRMSRREIYTACSSPSSVTVMNFQLKSTLSPGVMNRFSRNMSTSKKRMGLMALPK